MSFNTKYIWLYSLILFLSFSCYSKMKITVDTFDRNAFMNSHDYKINQGTKTVERVYNKINLISNYEDGLWGYEVLIQKNNSIPSQEKDSLIAEIKYTLDSMTKDASERYSEALKVYWDAADRNRFLNVDLLRSSELQADLILKNLFDAIDMLLRTVSSFPLLEIEGVSEVNKSILSSSFGNSILGDPMASLITRAPEKYWRKYNRNVNIKLESDLDGKRKLGKARYNRVKAQTFFGNADIAVKMDDPGSFTIKGVRMDATESIKTSFKVLNQGIKYISFAAGIPVPNHAEASTSNGTSQEVGSMKIPSISDNEILKNEVMEAHERIDSQTKSFLSVYFFHIKIIDSQDPDMDPNRRKESIEIIKKAYKVFKSQAKTTTQ